MGINTICNFCKKEFVYYGGKAHFNRSKNHYCSLGHIAKHGLAPKGKQSKIYKLWCGIHKRSKIKGIEFDIKPEEMPKIPNKCPILDVEISLNNNVVSDNSPSIDRIDPKKGYVKGNIQIISNRANRIKADATPEEIIKVGKYMEELWKNIK